MCKPLKIKISNKDKDKIIALKKLYGPFLCTGFNCLKAAEPLLGDSLHLTTKSERKTK